MALDDFARTQDSLPTSDASPGVAVGGSGLLQRMLSWVGASKHAVPSGADAAPSVPPVAARQDLLSELDVASLSDATGSAREFDPKAFMRQCIAFYETHRAEWFEGGGLVVSSARRPPQMDMVAIRRAFELAEEVGRTDPAAGDRYLQGAHLYQATLLRAAALMAPFVFGAPQVKPQRTSSGRLTQFVIELVIPSQLELPDYVPRVQTVVLDPEEHVYVSWPAFHRKLMSCWASSWNSALYASPAFGSTHGVRGEYAAATQQRTHGAPDGPLETILSELRTQYGTGRQVLDTAAQLPVAIFTDLRAMGAAVCVLAKAIEPAVVSIAMSHHRYGYQARTYGLFELPEVRNSILSAREEAAGALAVFNYGDRAIQAILGDDGEIASDSASRNLATSKAFLSGMRSALSPAAEAVLAKSSPRFFFHVLPKAGSSESAALRTGRALGFLTSAHVALLERAGMPAALLPHTIIANPMFARLAGDEPIDPSASAGDQLAALEQNAGHLAKLTAAAAMSRRHGAKGPFRVNGRGEAVFGDVRVGWQDLAAVPSPEALLGAEKASRLRAVNVASHARLIGAAMLRHADAGKKPVFSTTVPSAVSSVPKTLNWEIVRVSLATDATRTKESPRGHRESLVTVTLRDPRVPAAWATVHLNVGSMAESPATQEAVASGSGVEVLRLGRQGESAVSVFVGFTERPRDPLLPLLPQAESNDFGARGVPDLDDPAFSPAGSAMVRAPFAERPGRASEASVQQVREHLAPLRGRMVQVLGAALRKNPAYLFVVLPRCLEDDAVTAEMRSALQGGIKPISGDTAARLLRGLTTPYAPDELYRAGALIGERTRSPLWRSPSGRTLLDIAAESSLDRPPLVQGLLAGLGNNPALQSPEGRLLLKALVQSAMTPIAERCPLALPDAVRAGGEVDPVTRAAYDALLPMRVNDDVRASVLHSEMRQRISVALAERNATADAESGTPHVAAPAQTADVAPARRRRAAL